MGWMYYDRFGGGCYWRRTHDEWLRNVGSLNQFFLIFSWTEKNA